jgi:dienelactone hydrolase
VQTQSWNLVYLPYCTGDTHAGNAVVVFTDADPRHPRTQHFAGQANIREAAKWLRSHYGRPGQLMLTGFSAGGVGSTAQYAIVRDALAPKGRTTLLADSGPLFNAPMNGTAAQYPSLPLQTKIRATWGLDGPQGLIPTLAAKLPALDTNDMGSLNAALAQKYPKDRFGYMLYQADEVFSGFSYYDFYPAIQQEPDPDVQQQMINALWRQDIAQWTPSLDTQPNISYWIPFFRDFNGSHCLTIVDFSGTGIEDQGYADVSPFINANLGRGAVLRKTEVDQVSDLHRPLSTALEILSIVLTLFG